MEVIHLDTKTLENKMAEKLVALKKKTKKQAVWFQSWFRESFLLCFM